MHNTRYDAYEKYQISKNNKNNNKINYLTDFSSHCNYEQIALHTCGAKMLEINSYIICSECKKCFFDICIQGYCPFSSKIYYFKKIDKINEKQNFEPATWEEYHCENPLINKQMSCVRCG